MVSTGQTLKHKTKNILVRIIPYKNDKIQFIDKEGNMFWDNLNNYTHIDDEFGRTYVRQPTNGQFVDESAEKYLCSKRKMLEMRKYSLLRWEKRVFERMAGINCKTCDIPKKLVFCPFADGSMNHMARNFFLKRRKAIPLIVTWSKNYKKGGKDGFKTNHTTMCFCHTDNKIWFDNNDMLQIIDIKALKKVCSMLYQKP